MATAALARAPWDVECIAGLSNTDQCSPTASDPPDAPHQTQHRREKIDRNCTRQGRRGCTLPVDTARCGTTLTKSTREGVADTRSLGSTAYFTRGLPRETGNQKPQKTAVSIHCVPPILHSVYNTEGQNPNSKQSNIPHHKIAIRGVSRTRGINRTRGRGTKSKKRPRLG